MSNPVPPLSPTPKRKVLHERQSSQNNQLTPVPTLRLVRDEDDIDVYSATPYPTKPEQVLVPTTGDGHQDPFEHDEERDVRDTVSYTFQDPASRSTVTSSVDSLGEAFAGGPHGGSVSEFSSIAQGGASSSQVWLDDVDSSKASVGNSPIHQTLEQGEDGDEDGSDSSGITLPPVPQTIKTVPPDSSPQSTPSPPSTAIQRSTPPEQSSPNVIPFTSSSPNLVPVGSSSPNFVKEKFSDSSLYSANSFGTARRYTRPGLQDQSPPIASYIYSDTHDSTSRSIPSSPPSAVLRTFRSSSSLALPPPESDSYTRARASSKGSTPSSSDEQSVSSSGPPIQYPTVRAPSSTGSRAESSTTLQQPTQSMTEHSGRWNPHLSTIPSEWSAEHHLSVQSSVYLAEQSRTGRLKPSSTPSWDPSHPSITIVDESEDEHSDHLGYLRPVTPANNPLSPQSSISRLSSLRSDNRPGSSASSIFRVIPSWARVYYKSGGLALQLSALSLVEGSRPSTGVAEAQIVSPVPAELTRPRTRIQEPEPADPRDPRAHWRDGMEVEEVESVEPSAAELDPGTWSPHLVQDKGVQSMPRNPWKPPSLDEAAEGLFGWRNAQIYAFCLGFIFPLAWLFASFFPLPPAVDNLNGQATTSRPDLENALQNSVSSIDDARHESARWWRRVNRLMTPVGFVIIAVVITLAVLGTRGAL